MVGSNVNISRPESPTVSPALSLSFFLSASFLQINKVDAWALATPKQPLGFLLFA